MRKMSSIAVMGLLIVASSGAGGAELPTFELKGFPITPHQVAVLGGTDVQEQSRTPMLTLGGMPASPHQIAVLSSRPTLVAPPIAPELSVLRVSSP
jgi:hypothetical protein